MADKHESITFDEFTIDAVDESFWRGSERIHLRPKSFAFLQYLATHPGEMIPKERLLDVLWKDCFVGDGALKHCVAEIRKVLGDPAESPRFIETAHRRGYRFIGKIGSKSRAKAGLRTHPSRNKQEPCSDALRLVGRTSELVQLQQHFERAMEGTRQIVFVTGEQGIGKTALVDAFLKSVSSERVNHHHRNSREGLRVARGQCVKTHGAGEAFMPLLDAFTGLCHTRDRRSVMAILHRHAPLWLLQLPSLVDAALLRNLQRVTLGATRERMLREVAEALEAITAEVPLILVLEDLHWSDNSTLDLISYWAQRRSPTRLLLIGTYRPAEAMADNHPLKTVAQELQAHQLCREMPLGFLSQEAIRTYLARRFAGHKFPAEIVAWIHRRTEGNPLFMVNVLDHLVAHGFITQSGESWTLNLKLEKADSEVPPTIQQIIERQIERCSSQEQHLLLAASVVGVEFSAAAAAAALGRNADRIESLCRGLAKRHVLLQSAAIHQLPGGKRDPCYRFSHVLYQYTCYQRLPEDLKTQLHRRLAEYIERTHRRRISDFAAPLAMHFEQGREYSRAIKYYQQAAANANWRYAGQEAKSLAEHGIKLLEEASVDSERALIEIGLQIELGTALVTNGGRGSDEVKRAFARAPELLRKLGRDNKSDLPFSALWGLWNYSRVAAEYSAARETAERMLQLAEAEQDTAMLDRAHYALGITMMDHGEFAGALQHMEYGTTTVSRVYTARILWILGYPDRALKHVEETLARALAVPNTEDCIFAYMAMARVHVMRREIERALDCAQKALSLARQQHILELWLSPMRGICGWALAKLGRTNEGIEQMRQILAAYKGIRHTNIKPFLWAMLAEILGDAGQIEEALAAVQDSLDAARSTGMKNHEAEIFRLRGELLLKKVTMHRPSVAKRLSAEAESCFEQAVAISCQQQAKSFELRATASLARLWQKQNRPAEARERLTTICHWFTEGRDTLDLREARDLIRELREEIQCRLE
jgi:DNA-binding winged helix-turn-helix (wHTH) protein/tetratricopeptide (TPR) repeat protein